MLAGIYGWFTEGFDTAVLQEAKALLVELKQNAWLPVRIPDPRREGLVALLILIIVPTIFCGSAEARGRRPFGRDPRHARTALRAPFLCSGARLPSVSARASKRSAKLSLICV